jgi:hypothetical protein
MGDAVTGGTVYWLNDAVDGGPIAAQEHVFIVPGGYVCLPTSGPAAFKTKRKQAGLRRSHLTHINAEHALANLKEGRREGSVLLWGSS